MCYLNSYLHEYAQFGYFPTYHHVAPYAMGTFVGYLIVRHLSKPIRLSKPILILGWILSPIPSIWVLICTREWNDYRTEDTPSLTTSVVFSVLQRLLWTIGIAWVSFVCAIGQGGIVNRILSAKAFIPFSRLSYSIYMVHLIPIFLRANSLKYTRAWDDFEFISWGVFNIILGIFAAYILFVIFESPINSLEKLIFRGGGTDGPEGSDNKKKTGKLEGRTSQPKKDVNSHRNMDKFSNGISQVSDAKMRVKTISYQTEKNSNSMSTFSAYKLKGPLNGSTGISGLTNKPLQMFTLPSVTSSSFGHLYTSQSVPSYPSNTSYNVHLKYCRRLPYDSYSFNSMSGETSINHQTNLPLSLASVETESTVESKRRKQGQKYSQKSK